MPLAPLGSDTAADRPFSELLRRQRIRAGLTQRALADLSTVSARAIRDLEAGRANARTQTIHLLVDGLRLQGVAREEFIRASLSGRRTGPFDLDGTAAAPGAIGALHGRDAEVGALVKMLSSGSRRMVSLSGLPGVGKSRMAAEIAARVGCGHDWPVLWLGTELPGAGPTLEPAPRSLRALLDESAQDAIAHLRRLVGRHRAVLVLDGVPEATLAAGVADLLSYCPGLRLISTSRAPWHVPGVQAAVVSPLATPGPEGPAGYRPETLAEVPSVRLFVERLGEVRPGFTLDRANAGAVAALCRRLDGLPLALEVAACQGRVLSVHQLTQLPVPELLDLGVPARGDERPRTLGGLLGATVARLSDGQRALLRELVRHDRAWTVPEVAAVARCPLGETVGALDVLVGRGLVRTSHGEPADGLRVPNLLRTYLRRELAAGRS
ncbi:Helix-turn-helix domain-containing protein [Micromonospora echinofusca]|uniref:Helix-turn-helix domain-containing protein n=2 Tax=Micromonospora echinofusca TaxID=47858 RepID=A0A1C5GHD7_MICEH|nr:Helix-turn-helix domain-containing protein [Micromonospora echinofusca]